MTKLQLLQHTGGIGDIATITSTHEGIGGIAIITPTHRGIGDIATITPDTQRVLVTKLQLLQHTGGIGDRATITSKHRMYW